jgi:GntR family phosphonate transport system transcriptional regulator
VTAGTARAEDVMEHDGISRWRQIGDALVDEMSRGGLAPGNRLPSELDLARRFGVARKTVRRALSYLQDEGFLRTEHGRGSFVTSKVIEFRVGARRFFEQSLSENAVAPARKLVAMSRAPAPASLVEMLRLNPDEDVLQATMLGLADGIPVAFMWKTFPLSRLPQIARTLRSLARRSPDRLTLLDILKEAGVKGARRQSMRMRARPPVAEEIRHLRIDPHEHVFEIEVVLIDAQGRPVQHDRTAYCGSRVEFVIGREVFDVLDRA